MTENTKQLTIENIADLSFNEIRSILEKNRK